MNKVDYVGLGMGLTLSLGSAAFFAAVAVNDWNHQSECARIALVVFAAMPLVVAVMIIAMEAKGIMDDVKSRLMALTTKNMEEFQTLVSGLLEANPGTTVEFLGDWFLVVKDGVVIASWRLRVVLGVGFVVGRIHTK